MGISKTRSNIIILLIKIICGVLMALCIQDGHDWGDDFALYIEQAKCINNSSLNHLYLGNKFSMQHSLSLLGPYLYPNGFPLLLSANYNFFGINFIAMKAFCSFFLIISIPIIYRLYKGYFSNNLYVFFIIVAFAFHISFVTFSDNILSDFPFFFFSFLSLLLISKSNNASSQVILGICIFFTYFVRDIGIVLLPTLFVYQVSTHLLKKSIFTNKLYNAIPYLVFLFFFIVVSILLPKGGENHFSLLFTGVSIKSIISNIFYYTNLMSGYFFLKRSIFFILVIIIIFIGIFNNWQKNILFIAYTFFFSMVLIVWPGVQGIRFIFPLIPFALFFLLKGALYLFDRWNINPKYLHIVLVLFVLRLSLYTVKQTIFVKQIDSNQSYTTEMVEIYHYISKNIPEQEIIGFFKPRALRLFTGRNAIETDLQHFETSVASYLLVEKKSVGESISKYRKLYETPNYLLITKLN